MHMAMFLLPKFEIHSLKKKMPWTLLTLSLSSADWPLARCPWPMATDPWAINPGPWALGSSQGPRALCSTDQDDAIMSKSHNLMDIHWISAGAKVIMNIWACFCNANPGLHHLNPGPGIDPWALVMVHDSWSLPQIMQSLKKRMNSWYNHVFST